METECLFMIWLRSHDSGKDVWWRVLLRSKRITYNLGEKRVVGSSTECLSVTYCDMWFVGDPPLWISFSSGVIGHRPLRSKGGEAISMVQKAMSIKERTLGGELQRDSLLCFPRVRCIMALRALRVMAGKGWLIITQRQIIIQAGGKRNTYFLSHTAFSVFRELCAGSSPKQW